MDILLHARVEEAKRTRWCFLVSVLYVVPLRASEDFQLHAAGSG